MVDYNYYRVPEIKAELKKRGLPPNGKKAGLVARFHIAIKNEFFAVFPKLPAELRNRIWAFALPPRPIIDISTSPMSNSFSICRPSLTAVMKIMLTSKEAYGFASRRYWPIPTPPWCNPSRDNCHKRAKANFHDDIFHLSEVSSEVQALVRMDLELDPALMETVSFPLE
jgi:hypothetical protein